MEPILEGWRLSGSSTAGSVEELTGFAVLDEDARHRVRSAIVVADQAALPLETHHVATDSACVASGWMLSRPQSCLHDKSSLSESLRGTKPSFWAGEPPSQLKRRRT